MSSTLHLKGKVYFKASASRRSLLPTGSRPTLRSFRTYQSSSVVWCKMEDALQAKVSQLQAELDSLHKAITVLNQLAAELDIHTAMQNVRQVALELLDCERVTLFLIFERRRELRAMIDQNRILRIQYGEGIAGLVAQTGGSMNLPDVYEHPMFNKEVDRITGFRTRNMLCMAVSDMTGKNVAVLQALNKKTGQPFTPADERHLKLFGTHLGNTLVKAKLHETAKREKERLQAIYTCFKSLNAAEEVGQMVECATAALERHIIHAEWVLFFLVDKPRGELWLHTHLEEPMRLRIGPQGGVVGMCAESKKAQSWAEFEDPSQDPVLRRLAAQLAPTRVKSVLVQPIHGTTSDRVLAVVLAINKRETEGTSDIFFEPFFTDADCDAMALFAYEAGDLLSVRTLELSLLSALSVVGQDGAHPNAVAQQARGAGGSCEDGTSTPGGAASLSGEEDLIRSRLLQMYLPEYKNREVSGSHAMFNRTSFSAATVTANQMRASMDRKRSAYLSLSLLGDGGPAAAKRAGSGSSPNGSLRRSDLAQSSDPRMALAVRAAAARSFGLGSGRAAQADSFRSEGGLPETDPGAAVAARAVPACGSPHDAPSSPVGDYSDASSDVPVLSEDLSHLRTRSSTQAEHPAVALRLAGRGGVAAVLARSGGSLTAGAGNSAASASVRSSLMGPVSAGCMSLPSVPPAQTHLQHLLSPQRNGWAGGGGGAVPRRMSAHARLMAPWRRSMKVQSAGGTLGAVTDAGDGDADGDGGNNMEGLSGDVDDSDGDADGFLPGSYDSRGRDGRTANGAADAWAMAEESAAAVAAGAMALKEVESSGSGSARSLPARLAMQLPEPFGEFGTVQEELRAAAAESLRLNVCDPQALRTHLSCTNLAQASSPRSPCFYPADKLSSWDWDFTEFTVEELIKLAYDMFIISGAMADFELQPKVLRNFLTAVASHYQSIPYHNFNHVCHVLQATYLISTRTSAANVLTPLERLSLLISALCHDLDHDGHSNSFHVNSGSELSRIYNDQSVMENHHCAMTFAILSRTDCNLMAVLSPEEQRTVRKLIISAILCTDMGNHFALTQEFQKHSVTYESDSESDRLLLTKVILHAADIGNAVRPFHVNHAMSRRVHREFEAQSHEEIALGLPVTFSVDTSDHVMCARVELNFLDYVVTTLWERLVDVLPELTPQLAQLRVNRARYRRIADTGKTAELVLTEEAQEEELQQQQQLELQQQQQQSQQQQSQQQQQEQQQESAPEDVARDNTAVVCGRAADTAPAGPSGAQGSSTAGEPGSADADADGGANEGADAGGAGVGLVEAGATGSTGGSYFVTPPALQCGPGPLAEPQDMLISPCRDSLLASFNRIGEDLAPGEKGQPRNDSDMSEASAAPVDTGAGAEAG